MSEYIITKRVECEKCHGHGTVPTPNVPQPIGECPDCKGQRYVETLVDADEWLLSRLAKLRWDVRVDENVYATETMRKPRFEGDER